MRTVICAFFTALTLSAPAAAQEPTRPPDAVLTGTVFDSLTGRPVQGADVLLGAGEASARTDTRGRFTLRARAGSYQVGFTARGVSAWSALRHDRTVMLRTGETATVSLATASPETVVARTCTTGGVVGGKVQDLLTLVPLAATYVDVQPTGRGLITVHTVSDGGWFVCLGDPSEEVEVQARMGQARSRTVKVGPGGNVRIQDLFVAVAKPAELLGRVVDGPSGDGLADATVELVGTRLRTVTRPDGTFTFRGVPPGEIRVAVERLGYGRRVASVHAEGGSTARVTMAMFPEAIATDSVVVTVEGGMADRNRMPTRFDGLTRADIDKLLPRSLAFDDLLRNANVPGLKVREVRYVTSSGVGLPGICVETSRSSSFSSDKCEMVEVYVNDVRMMDAEMALQTLDPGSVDRFQLLNPTQAGIQYMGTPRSQNGVLLIWTRRR